MIKSMGYCHGIENYSRHFSGRLPGEPPPTLLDYFPRDFLLFVDESHATIPQVHGMWFGDHSRAIRGTEPRNHINITYCSGHALRHAQVIAPPRRGERPGGAGRRRVRA